MEQKVNFYPLLERPGRDWLNTRLIAILCVLVLVIVAVIDVVMLAEQRTLYRQLSDVRQEIDLTRKNANELRSAQQRGADKSIFEERIKFLEQERTLKQRIYTVMSLHPITGGEGFTPYMAAMANQTVKDLWFTEIDLNDAGRDIVLIGRSRDPEAVAKYLQALNNETAFRGRQFSSLRIEPDKAQAWLYDFELRTFPDKQQKNK